MALFTESRRFDPLAPASIIVNSFANRSGTVVSLSRTSRSPENKNTKRRPDEISIDLANE